MAVAMALFTRDLRIHDNPVLVAAAKNGDAVLPVFIVDDAITAGNYLNPNKARFLAAALAGLDDELRRRGGRLTVRHGPTVAEVERMVVDLLITEVHVASDVSGYAQSRERRLRDRLAARGCRLEVHSSSVTVSEPGELTPLNGQDHFAVFTPYYRKWNAAGIRPGAAPDYPDRIVDHHEAIAAARISGGNPQSVSVASGAHGPS
jgi:deoxyribodipyrimidine photo-lyase